MSILELPSGDQIPPILVIGGFIFIFVAFAKVSGYINIEVAEEKETTCLFIGIVCFFLGVMLSIYTPQDRENSVKLPPQQEESKDNSKPESGNKPKSKSKKPLKSTQKIVIISLSIIAILVILGVWSFLNESEIKITYPLDGAPVDITESVKGTQKNIPEGDEIWIFVHPHTENKYYPQRSSAVIQNGEWSLSVGIGSENDDNITFDIIAVLADKQAQEEINTYFETCENTGECSGIDKVPDSAKEYDRITVIRKFAPEDLDPEIQIIYPSDGDKVDVTESVKGTQKNIPDDKALWIVLFPYKSQNYHPVSEVSIQDDISDFKVPAIIGTDGTSGEKFDIIALLADEKAQKAFTSYLEKANEQKSWPGIDLPNGTIEYDRVTVTRK